MTSGEEEGGRTRKGQVAPRSPHKAEEALVQASPFFLLPSSLDRKKAAATSWGPVRTQGCEASGV